jgi:hypothetical protein
MAWGLSGLNSRFGHWEHLMDSPDFLGQIPATKELAQTGL